MARVRALVARALLVLAVASGAAAAEVIDLPNTRATVTVDEAWTAVAAPGLVAGYRTGDGLLLAITRARVPNTDAWREKTRDAYAAEIERGIVAAGYQRTTTKLSTLEGVPTLDVEAKRADGAVIIVRILLFRTYALALAVEIPRGVSATRARSVVASFAPPAS